LFFVEELADVRSDRLRLRTPRRSDLEPIDEAITETLDELVRWLPWAQPGHKRADSRRYLKSARIARNRRHAFEFVIEDLATEQVLGMISLHRIDWIRRTAGVGYWIRRSAWGKGIATEAASTVLDLAFRVCRLQRVEVLVALENVASQRVAERIGMRREGIARGAEFVNGEFLDHIQYALLASDTMGSLE
jgi:RimJ/RimL family protein N-acetyltransferase